MTRPLILLLLVLAGVVSAHAQSTDTEGAATQSAFVAPPMPEAAPAPVSLSQTGWRSPALRRGLSASLAALQGVDVVTTVKGIQGGRAREANPFVRGLVDRPLVFGVFKAGLTVGTVAAMSHLAKRHPKATVISLIGMNALYIFAAQSNLRVLHATRRPR